MNIIVLAKQAIDPNSDIQLENEGNSIIQRDLVYDINEWDRFAIEEAIKIKEIFGGKILVVSVGSQCENTLRKALAMGADRAKNVPLDTMDPKQTAEVINEAIKDEEYDLILAGYQSQDGNNALTGPLLAGILKLPFATAVTDLNFEGERVKVKRELEGGYCEELILPIPCLVTVQTGINTPRYVPLIGIKRVKKTRIEVVDVPSINSTFEIENMSFPPAKQGEIIEGSPDDVAKRFVELVKSNGFLK